MLQDFDIFMYHNLCTIDIQVLYSQKEREDPDISCETTMMRDIETLNYCEEPKWYYNIMYEEDAVLQDKLVPEVKLTPTAQDHTIPRWNWLGSFLWIYNKSISIKG